LPNAQAINRSAVIPAISLREAALELEFPIIDLQILKFVSEKVVGTAIQLMRDADGQ
jgi:hypothetical protein